MNYAVTIDVPKMDEGLKFYRDALGLSEVVRPFPSYVILKCGVATIGLMEKAAGSKPAALDAAGVSVLATRSAAVLATGFLTGVGGAYLANVGAGLFVAFMTNGAGFIGIVLAMLARGRPIWVLGGARRDTPMPPRRHRCGRAEPPQFCLIPPQAQASS